MRYEWITLLICIFMVAGCGGGGKRHIVSVAQYHMEILDLPPGVENPCDAYSINDSGQVVGYIYGMGRVFWDTNGEISDLADPPDTVIDYADKVYLNESGNMASSAYIQQNGQSMRAVIRWHSSSEVEILLTSSWPNGGDNIRAIGITDEERVFCTQGHADGTTSIIIFNSDGSTTDGTPEGGLQGFSGSDCNNYGLVVGTAAVDGKIQAVVIDTNTKTLRILPLLSSLDPATGGGSPAGINNQGIIAGTCYDSQGSRWVMWDALGNIHDLGCPPGYYGPTAFGINDSNMVIGAAGREGAGACAFVRLPDGRFVNFGLFEGIAASMPRDINNLGQVAGVSYAPNQVGAYIARAVIWSPSNL